jgi:GH15 family glucan-1,4-alpha-glucosidase
MTPIEEYAIIGNGRSAALVSRDGSIDWLCWPRFDSPSVFAALLDEEAGGSWRIVPTVPYRASRRYVGDSNVLATRFETAGGAAIVTDLLSIRRTSDLASSLAPEHELLRLVTCESGEVELTSEFVPRPGFGRGPVSLRDRGAHGIALYIDGALVLLRSEVPHAIPEGDRASATFRLRDGASVLTALTYDRDAPAALSPLGEAGRAAIARTVEIWEDWAARASYDGPYRAIVKRSALTLKLLMFTPSGAIVAAPTTSLPERVGGDLNWDYRYCWLRDASLTARALFGLGYEDEGTAFVSWLLHTTRLGHQPLAPLYTVFGRGPRAEHVLDHLGGHRGSRPVRVGNAASTQRQLDVYGQVIDAAAQLAGKHGVFDRPTAALLRQLGDAVCASWTEPDEGIWELRTP